VQQTICFSKKWARPTNAMGEKATKAFSQRGRSKQPSIHSNSLQEISDSSGLDQIAEGASSGGSSGEALSGIVLSGIVLCRRPITDFDLANSVATLPFDLLRSRRRGGSVRVTSLGPAAIVEGRSIVGRDNTSSTQVSSTDTWLSRGVRLEGVGGSL
jgi:hypothetical protein